MLQDTLSVLCPQDFFISEKRFWEKTRSASLPLGIRQRLNLITEEQIVKCLLKDDFFVCLFYFQVKQPQQSTSVISH